MKTSKSSLVKSTFTCGRCSMLYFDYKRLLEHLYWRHGTESFWCKQCELKRWRYAVHVCHVLPINYEILEDSDLNSEDPSYYSERETDFCSCGKYIADAPMIGCDGPSCQLQWYHFSCVGITSPPEGDWLCPTCVKSQRINQVIVAYRFYGIYGLIV
ncbi:hypothetical protein B5X24_HaOG206204 [Helicoverpa armigera]|nr:hypothetical protein B5X24_HaOG206204 [Helicoverpa armigera]